MAELLLKVTNQTLPPDRYQDGDIVCAFNQRRIRAVHAQHICHPKNFGFKADGRRPDSLAKHLLELTYQYRFERISYDTITRTDLVTQEIDVIGAKPNSKGEHMNVPLFIERRLKHPNHNIFGTPGHEVWYGGRIDYSNPALDKVWTKIQEQSEHREENYTEWPLSPLEKRHFLALPTDDFDDAVQADYETPELNEAGEIIRKRKHAIPWREVLPTAGRTLLVNRILNRDIEIDLRKTLPRLDRLRDIRRKT